MARPIKRGIDYFPLDVTFLRNIKVRKILRAHSEKSIAVLISLLGLIYEDKGYYSGWDNDISFLIADEIGVSEGLVTEVVNKAVQVDFFDEDKFKKYEILTSKGIQNRYLEAIKKRKKIELIEEYLVIDINDVINLDNVCINSINDTDNTQRRVKETKVNKSKDSSKNKFSDDSLPIKISKHLYKKILANDPKAKKPNLQTWAGHVDKLIRLDNRNDEVEIKQVIDFATSSDFWKSNILSTEKLRKQYSTLKIQMESQNNKIKNKPSDDWKDSELGFNF